MYNHLRMTISFEDGTSRLQSQKCRSICQFPRPHERRRAAADGEAPRRGKAHTTDARREVGPPTLDFLAGGEIPKAKQGVGLPVLAGGRQRSLAVRAERHTKDAV